MEWTRSIRDRFLFTFDLSPDGKASVSVSTERDPGSIFLFHLASPSVLHSPMFIYYLILVQLSILNSFDRK